MMETWQLLLSCLVAVVVYGLNRLNKVSLRANEVDWGHGWANRVDGLSRLFCRRYHRLQPVSLDLPEQGPAIVVSNHISGLDPLLLVSCCRRPVRFMIAREQYERFGLKWLFRAAGCIPVDRERSPEKALRAAFRALRDGEVVAIFPHGKIHLETDPPRRLKAGASRLAAFTGAPLVPLRIAGVRGQGHVFSSLVLRGGALVTPYPVIDPAGQTSQQLNERLQQIIDG
ncbi:lysophospholipid acyltransferase family protein [endosymbiont of Lamellibrachia barhami]|uniref:lysophospholipid acyltransferase family protein n=1 Tax=endosymbiont of Lamellibrachia barhami TaxID=205975 RepID=UPI0015B313B8|nr:lysophospholipid acyltransferase family protein [endosymbiont of Lamellibrachia barhami]